MQMPEQNMPPLPVKKIAIAFVALLAGAIDRAQFV